jgi:hypothetical protein
MLSHLFQTAIWTWTSVSHPDDSSQRSLDDRVLAGNDWDIRLRGSRTSAGSSCNVDVCSELVSAHVDFMYNQASLRDVMFTSHKRGRDCLTWDPPCLHQWPLRRARVDPMFLVDDFYLRNGCRCASNSNGIEEFTVCLFPAGSRQVRSQVRSVASGWRCTVSGFEWALIQC